MYAPICFRSFLLHRLCFTYLRFISRLQNSMMLSQIFFNKGIVYKIFTFVKFTINDRAMSICSQFKEFHCTILKDSMMIHIYFMILQLLLKINPNNIIKNLIFLLFFNFIKNDVYAIAQKQLFFYTRQNFLCPHFIFYYY